MKKQIKPIIAYIKDKIKPSKIDVRYYEGKEYGIENTVFNFSVEPIKEPYGDVAFSTGYDSNPDYTSTFLMSAQQAMELGKLLIDVAYESMNNKRIKEEAESCDAKLSFLVLKGLIDSIRINRSTEKLENYEPPFYKYTVSAYKDDEKVFTYETVYNLSYFTTEGQIQYWMDKLTDKGRVKLYTNWDLHKELEERKNEAYNRALNSAHLNLKPAPIKKENLNDNNKIKEFLNKNTKM